MDMNRWTMALGLKLGVFDRIYEYVDLYLTLNMWIFVELCQDMTFICKWSLWVSLGHSFWVDLSDMADPHICNAGAKSPTRMSFFVQRIFFFSIIFSWAAM